MAVNAGNCASRGIAGTRVKSDSDADPRKTSGRNLVAVPS